jgi:sugar phosphate isomerase/epimerase
MTDLAIGLCWGTLQRASLLELIELAGRYGFATITVRPATVLAEIDTGVGAQALRRKLSDAGVRVAVIDGLAAGLPGMPRLEDVDPISRAVPMATEADGYRAAEAVHCPVVNVAHFTGKPVPLEQMSEALAGVCERAAKRGLEVTLEFIPGTGLPDLVTTLNIRERVGAPNCSIMLDPWHLARSGGTLEQVQQAPPGSIGGVQLCDRTPPPPGQVYVPMSGRDLPGEGVLPLTEVVQAVLRNRPGVTAEVEVFNDELRSLSLDAAAARTAAAVGAWRKTLG